MNTDGRRWVKIFGIGVYWRCSEFDGRRRTEDGEHSSSVFRPPSETTERMYDRLYLAQRDRQQSAIQNGDIDPVRAIWRDDRNGGGGAERD